MKKLIILRHGKSSWENPLTEDHNRELVDIGKKRTKTIAKYLIINNSCPELIISSSAKRTFQTAKIIAKKINYNIKNIKINSNLYFVDVEKYFETVYSTPDNINSLMIVGHNPMITNFCNYFLNEPIDNLPTSGLCVVNIETDNWQNLSKYTVEHIVFPKKLEKEKSLLIL